MSKKPPKGELTRVVAYLFEDELQMLDERTEEERTSRSEVIRRAPQAYLSGD